MAAKSKSAELTKAIASLTEATELDTFVLACSQPAIATSAPATSLLFCRFKEDEADIQALAEFLWSTAINYVIPIYKRREVIKKAKGSKGGADLSGVIKLRAAAKAAFLEFNVKHPHRASEVGELLAYCMALRFLNAAQIASKMALKTSGNMPVHGLDGIHAGFEGNILTLYFLESKLSATANGGAADFAKSVAGFGNNRKQYLLEYSIIQDLGNLDALTPDLKALALEYLDVYGPKKSGRLERAVGVILYSEKKHFGIKLPKSKFTAPADHEKHFIKNYEAEYAHHQGATKKHLESNKVDPKVCHVFFVAVPDINVLRDTFYKVMNG